MNQITELKPGPQPCPVRRFHFVSMNVWWMNDLNEYFMPGFHNLSSVVLKLLVSLLNCLHVVVFFFLCMWRHSAHTFRLFSIRTCIWICPQLYRNNARTFRKLGRCQQQFGRLSWSWTVPPYHCYRFRRVLKERVTQEQNRSCCRRNHGSAQPVGLI